MTNEELFDLAVKAGVITPGVCNVSPNMKSLRKFAELLSTPTADTGMAREIAEALWGVTEEQSRALQTPYCTYEPPSEDFKQATIRRYTEAIASRLSTREQEVAQLIESVINGPWLPANERERLRAALDKVRAKT